MGVLSGGIFNMFGDYFFVFTCNMGIFGAGLATAIGSGVSFLVMLTHFASRKNTLRLVKVERLRRKLREICVTGFSTFFIDVAMGILTVLFNRQIMKYLGSNALAIYGPIIQVSTFVQCCAYSVGQAAQPIISTNFGAGKGDRIRETLKLALWTTAFFGAFWTILSMVGPNFYIRVFMSPTPEILSMAPAIIRTYALSFLLLPFNIFSTYYFQAIMKPRAAFNERKVREGSGGAYGIRIGIDFMWIRRGIFDSVLYPCVDRYQKEAILHGDDNCSGGKYCNEE